MKAFLKMLAIIFTTFTLPWISCEDSSWQPLADSLVDDGLGCGLIAGLDGTVWASARCSPKPNEVENIVNGFKNSSYSLMNNGIKFEGYIYYKIASDRKNFQGRSGKGYLTITMATKALILGLSYSREKLNEDSRRVKELAEMVNKLAP